MFPQRNIFRLTQRSAQQLRSAPVRSAIQRRFNSTDSKLPWMVDNAFNREREAVKHHAASTSGAYTQLARCHVRSLFQVG
jgi:cytochrome c oxidase subunit 6a